MELHDHPAPFPAGEPELPELPRCGLEELPPPDVYDPVIEAYKKDVDRTLLVENLKLTPDQCLDNFRAFVQNVGELLQQARGQ